MPSQPAPTPAAEPPPKPASPPPDVPPPVPDGAPPEPAEEGAIFHALLDAGVEAKLAYTAEKRMHAVTSKTIAEHTQPILVEVRQLAAQVRDLAETVAKHHRELTADIQALKEDGAGRDRKLDVLTAQMRLVIGAFGLLITALIAVFGILFTR